MKKMQQRKQKGFTLVELGIVLALIGIGLFFAISKLRETSDTSRAQNFSNEMAIIFTKTRDYYKTVANVPNGNVNLVQLINNGVFPDAWRSGANLATLTAPFGGAVTLDSDGAGNLVYTIPGVPDRVCAESARLMSNGVSTMAIDGVNVKTPGDVLNIARVGNQCRTTPSIMAFTIPLR